MDPVEFKSLVDGSWEAGPHQERVERFAKQFNQNFNRKVLGSGPYVIEDPERDLVTQQKVVLTAACKLLGSGRGGNAASRLCR